MNLYECIVVLLLAVTAVLGAFCVGYALGNYKTECTHAVHPPDNPKKQEKKNKPDEGLIKELEKLHTLNEKIERYNGGAK